MIAVLAACACGNDYPGGGRRHELPAAATGGASEAGSGGAGGVGLSGSSDSGVADATDGRPPLEDCPTEAGTPVQTGDPCMFPAEAGSVCRRNDGAACTCRADLSVWECA
jgi:hypothetical protein